MRRVLCLILVLVLVATSGCTQPATTPSTVSTVEQSPVTPIPVAATTVTVKNLTFDVSKTEKTVNVTYTGGPDAADVLALDIQIDNQDGTRIKQIFPEPAVGTPFIFTYMGLANPVTVNIIGTFRGGYQQTVLLYYF